MILPADLPFAITDPVCQQRCFHEVRHSTPWFEGSGGLWNVWFGRRWNMLYAHGRRRGLDERDCVEGRGDWFSIARPCADAETCTRLIAELMRHLHRCKKPREKSAGGKLT